VPLRPPTEEDLGEILARVIKRVIRELRPPDEDATDAEVDAFAALQAAEVDRRLRFPDPFKHARCAAALDGFSLHAGVRIHANDREGLERLCRYAVRPPFALHRLSQGPDGRLVYRMKRPRGGSLFLLLTPDELIARIATLVPPPRTHALRYHGLFAPHSKHRARVVPRREPTVVSTPHEHGGWQDQSPPHGDAPPATTRRTEPAGAFALTPPEPPPGRPAPRYRIPWAELLQKVFAVDVLECPRCAGRLELIAFINEPKVARKILDHLGLASQAPPLARSSAPGEDLAGDPGPDYTAADSTPED